jgi:hypothetical protein
MKVGNDEVSFKWGNYLQPTPVNLERLSSAIRDAILGLGTVAVVNDYKWLSAGIMVSGIILNQFVKFFSSVKEEENGKDEPK